MLFRSRSYSFYDFVLHFFLGMQRLSALLPCLFWFQVFMGHHPKSTYLKSDQDVAYAGKSISLCWASLIIVRLQGSWALPYSLLRFSRIIPGVSNSVFKAIPFKSHRLRFFTSVVDVSRFTPAASERDCRTQHKKNKLTCVLQHLGHGINRLRVYHFCSHSHLFC